MGALDEVRDLAAAVTRRRSLKLWDVEMAGQPGRAVVRVFVDAAEGSVDLDTVAEVSEEISRGLDLRAPLESSYMLEVSSPGLERSLKRPEHWAASVGKKVMVKTKKRLAGDSHRIDGVVKQAAGGVVTLDLGTDELKVPYDEIRTARTVFEWSW